MERQCRRIRRASVWGLLALLLISCTADLASARQRNAGSKASRIRHVTLKHKSRKSPVHAKSRKPKSDPAEIARSGPPSSGKTALVRQGPRRLTRRQLARQRRQRRRGPAEPGLLGMDAAGQPRLRSRAAIVYDPTTGQILYAKNEDQCLPIASLTKIMTAMVVLDRSPDWDSTVTMQRSDIYAASRTRLRSGERIVMRDLFQLALMVSDNAATRALVRSSGLEHEDFVREMNRKAQALGLTGTHFVEETGLDPANVSTASDYARLLSAACRVEKIADVTSTPHYEFTSSRGRHMVANTDRLLYGRWDVMGGKTGFINEAGYCFATCVRSAGRQLVSVVLGAPTKGTRFAETARLLDWAGASSAAEKVEARLSGAGSKSGGS